MGIVHTRKREMEEVKDIPYNKDFHAIELTPLDLHSPNEEKQPIDNDQPRNWIEIGIWSYHYTKNFSFSAFKTDLWSHY